MLKLPSPSVVCAQNSPVILTIGLHARAIDRHLVEPGAHPLESLRVLVGAELVDELAELLAGAARPGRQAGDDAASAGSLERPRLMLAEHVLQVRH